MFISPRYYTFLPPPYPVSNSMLIKRIFNSKLTSFQNKSTMNIITISLPVYNSYTYCVCDASLFKCPAAKNLYNTWRQVQSLSGWHLTPNNRGVSWLDGLMYSLCHALKFCKHVCHICLVVKNETTKELN